MEIMTNTDFKNRYGPAALVTGASSGIGKSFAVQLAAIGMDLVLVARRVERLEALATQLKAAHRVQVTVCQVDLGEADAARRILGLTSALDVGLLISNAGYGFRGDHSVHDASALAAMLMVNCNTPMQLTNGFIPRLRKRHKGGIILTSSVEALIGCPYSAAYSASKAFVKNLGEALWGELTPEGIDVLTICPGATDTEALSRHGIDPARLPSVMSPDEVAKMALEGLRDGPVLITSKHYQATFDTLLSMPRRDALTAMAKSTKA
jgi:short-subunit dehydrogenase